MQNWRDIVTCYPDEPDPKVYGRALRTAEVLISEDLAPFEIEWLAQTLLFKPVHLFETITHKWKNEEWFKNVSDSFKILSKLVEKYWDVIDDYYSNVIELSMLPFDAQVRKEAILCLISVVKRTDVEVSEPVVSRLVAELEQAKTCKAPLAHLVGTICRYHPELVQNQYDRIWRIYLSMLQPNNKTDTLVNSVLQGVNGLFEYFGNDIQVVQLNIFYDQISRESIRIPKCLDVLLSIFKHHAVLFKERLAEDKVLRRYLWQIETKQAMEALSNIYKVILPDVANKEEIIKSEVLPHAHSQSAILKHSAIRIVVHAQCLRDQLPSLNGIDLEYLLRVKKLSYEEANTVSWCIEAGIDNSETMLLAAIMFYDNLPSNKKRDIVVNGILKATDETRKAALLLLLNLCLQDGLGKYLDIWRVLLDNTTGPDLAKAVLIFDEVLCHVVEELAWLGTEKSHTECQALLSLLSVLLSLQRPEYHTPEYCTALRPSLLHAAGQDLLRGLDDEMIYAERFEEDTVYSKLMSTLSIEDSSTDTLSALQIIFSREETDLKVLSIALTKLDDLIRKENNNLDKKQLSMMMNQILKFKSNNTIDSKDARIFQKDVALFLGKYGSMVRSENFSEDIYVLKLRNKITLNIPNVVEATTFKIDLQRVLQLCLLWEEREPLYSLLVILSANLSDRTDPDLQEATIRVIHALFRTKRGETETDIAVYPALLMCNTLACVQTLMKIITQEQCPTNRRKLSDCLEVLLTQDTEVTSQLVDTVAENVMYLLSTDDCSTIQLSLDITRAFLSTFKDNNSLAIKHLPQIIISTSNHKETEIFDLATKIYIEKIDLFNTENIKNTILNVIEKYIGNNNNVDIKIILEFIKQIVDIKKYDTECMINGVFDFCKKMSFSISQFLNIFALLANFNVFEVSCEVKTNIVCFNSGMFLNELMKIEFGKDDGFNKAPVLEFLKEYCMELYGMAPEKTSQCIFSIIENVDPKTIIILKKEITECLNIYKPLLNDVKLQQSYKKWLEKRNLDKITDLIKEKCLFSDFTQDISDKIQALKIISHLFNYTIEEVKNWTVLLLENLTDLELKWGKVFLSDVFFLSEKSLSKSDFEKILNGNLDFCKRYINVYFGRLLEQDLNLNGDQSMLLIDVIEYYSKDYKEEYFDSVLKFVDKLWPTFELTSNLDQKQSILLNLLSLPKPVGIDCLPVKWAVCLLTTEGGSLEDKTKIVRTLPAGEQYSILYRAFASNLPVRLCEMQGPYVAPLRALLDTLAGNGDPTLLDIVITLAGGDDTKGWWDHAIDACMASLAKRQDKAILSKAYHRATAGHSLAVCNRVFLPLLRHSARKFCEEYICTIVPELLSTRVACKQPADTESYRRQVKRYTITFNVLKIVFDKLPSEILECSVLNESAGSVKPWHFTEQACRYCVTISASTKCGEGASPELREACLWLQSAAYNCLTAAICRRKPNKKLYTRIFDAHAWANIVDKDAVYPFELQAYSTYRGTRSPRKPLEMLPSSSFTGTVRSRLFLTTLTENPLQYDMIPDEEDDLEDDQPPELEDSVLDAHGCLSTLTALLEHAATLEHNDWRSILIACLTAGTVLNVKWLLSQAICNASESLKSHAGELTPGLLQLIADTPQAYNNKFVLNNLHLEILTTIINWNSTDLPKNEHLDVSIEYLISTIMQYKHRKNLQRRLLNILNNILQIYGHMVIIKWTTFKDYCKDPPKDIFSLLPIFEKILKNKVHLPDLLPNIFLITDAKVWSGTYKLSEVCGLALSLADSATRGRYLPKYWQILNSARGYNVTGYIKILYYTQRYCRECCDLQQIKNITDLSAKIEKSKCLTIIANYLETADEFEPYCQDIFEIIFLCDLLEGEFKIEAMRIVGNGLKFMSAGLKEQVLGIVAQNCKNSSVAVRKEAYGVILKAFQAEFKPHHHYSTKRRLLDTTPILDSIDTEPHVVMALAGGLCDPDVVGTGLLEGLGECLSEDLTLRFAELFYILVYQSFYTKINNLDLRNCGHTLLTMLFKDLRNNDAFINSKLREEGLPQSILQVYETLTTKTKPKTMLRSSVTYRQTYKKVAERREIDVQISINELLDTFLQLAKTNTDACLELCAQVMKCLQGASRRFDLSSIISRQLYGIVKREPNSLTPLVLEACRIFVNGVSGSGEGSI